MFNIKDFIYKKHNKKYVSNLEKRVEVIREYIEEFYKLNDSELKRLFKEYSEELDSKDRLEKCFAIGYIVIERVKGLSLYDVQIQGAITLYEGKVAEMKTGEGKTITGFLPALLRATEGQVHICTVNEYLAKRDKEYLEPLFNFFDLTVAFNEQQDPKYIKKEHYKCNVIYGTGSTFGFDYLYDNMIQRLTDRCCSNENRFYALIDEIDLILIDEARTPLIIGAPFVNDTREILLVDKLVKQLTPEDYIVDTENHACYLTEQGEVRMMELARTEDLYKEDCIHLLHLIHQALVANYLYKRDIDYAIIEHKGTMKLCIIDTYTGRIQPDRRFSNGLHQALEAKHSDEVDIKEETKTTATITLQNFFKLYKHLSGMSGTAHEERDEFSQVYNLQVVEIRTNKPSQRVDCEPYMEVTKQDKWDRVLDKVIDYHNKEYPILIGTASVEDSEELSHIFNINDLKHTVLNAKQDKKEAEVISMAGKLGAITIATNMAGRGTDIIPESKEHPLVVFVTELNESSRIDNQLKGRTSRQGAYGITETILSTEDLIFSKSSLGDKLRKIREGQPATSKIIHIITKEVQMEFEGVNSSSRRQSLKYDDIIKEQRTLFYKSRDTVMSINDVDSLMSILSKLHLDLEYIEELKERNYLKDIELLQHFILFCMDKVWVDHIDRLESLKMAIGWRSQSGHNPIIIFQNEAQKLYDEIPDKVKEVMIDTLEEMKKSEVRKANAYDGDRKELK